MKKKPTLVKQIKKNKSNGSMYVIIDKSSGYEEGDFIKIEDLDLDNYKFK